MAKFTEHEIFNQILAEVARQRELWGEDKYHHPIVWSTILSEETGEVAKAALAIHFDMSSDQDYKEELVQVAAVCVSALISLDRSPQKHSKNDK